MIRESAVTRRLLRDEVRDVLLNAIFDGRIPAEAHMHESQLARDLEVSRTPLREALLRLEHEGFLARNSASQLFLKPLTAQEARELGTLIGAYEACAVKRFGLASPNALDALHTMLEQMRAVREPRRLVELDRRWHRAFIAKCPNEELLGHGTLLKERLARYELPFCESEEDGATALTGQKEALLGAAKQSASSVVRELESTWETRADRIAAWLP